MYPSNGWSCPGISGLQVELLCVCVSISWFISKPPRGWGWGEEWQTHQPETTDRDELILVVENSRHSNRVLHPGRVHRRVGLASGLRAKQTGLFRIAPSGNLMSNTLRRHSCPQVCMERRTTDRRNVRGLGERFKGWKRKYEGGLRSTWCGPQ